MELDFVLERLRQTPPSCIAGFRASAGEPPRPWDELFNVFLCDCQCRTCGQWSQPVDFGKL